MTTAGFAERQRSAWSRPPVDGVGYLSSADLLDVSDGELLAVAEGMAATRYGGERNQGGRWRDVLGLDQPGEGRVVIDFGCGTGVESVELAKAGYRVAVADIVPANIDLARRLGALHGFELTGVTLSMEPPYIPLWCDDRFDVFYASGVLHHIPWAREIMERARTILRPGGEARLMLYSDRGWTWATGHPPAEEVLGSQDFTRFVRTFDAVGDYADWYDRARIEARFGDLFTVERCEYMADHDRYLAAVLRRVD